MIRVYVYGDGESLDTFFRLANSVQHSFCFTPEPHEKTVSMHFSSRKAGPVYYVNADSGIDIATRQSSEISRYVGIPRDWYLLPFALMGLIQWRAITLNPLLRPEDFTQGCTRKCLYSRRKRPEEYALLFEQPKICWHCYRFYEQLCPEPEIQSLKTVVSDLKAVVRSTTKCDLIQG